MKKIGSFFIWLWKLPIIVKLIVLLACAGGAWVSYRQYTKTASSAVQYQTAVVARGTIVASVTASGTVATSNSTSITTQASGVISTIYVKDQDAVKAGDKIADVDLDMQGKQRVAQAYASYQSAKNSLQSAQDKYYTLQSSMMGKWKTYMDTAQSSLYQNADKTPIADTRNLPQFYVIKDDWLQTEADYKNQEGIVAQAQTAVNNAWLTYQQTSPTIYAPISGTITGLSLQVGSFITAQTNTSGTSTSQRIANIVTSAPPTVTVNLTEVDTPKVTIDDKATVTFDALPGKTFTGIVVSIDTVGSVTSGVTSYPTTIKLDVPDPLIFSNMNAQASVIIDMKSDTLLVPSQSVKTNSDGTKYVLLSGKTGLTEQNAVEAGISSDSQTEILSGLSEGDTVVVSQTSAVSNGNSGNQTRSIFGGGGFRMGGH